MPLHVRAGQPAVRAGELLGVCKGDGTRARRRVAVLLAHQGTFYRHVQVAAGRARKVAGRLDFCRRAEVGRGVSRRQVLQLHGNGGRRGRKGCENTRIAAPPPPLQCAYIMEVDNYDLFNWDKDNSILCSLVPIESIATMLSDL